MASCTHELHATYLIRLRDGHHSLLHTTGHIIIHTIFLPGPVRIEGFARVSQDRGPINRGVLVYDSFHRHRSLQRIAYRTLQPEAEQFLQIAVRTRF